MGYVFQGCVQRIVRFVRVILGCYGNLAPASDRLPRNRDATPFLLGPVLTCFHCCDDRHESAHRMGLRQHEKLALAQLMHISSTGSLVALVLLA